MIITEKQIMQLIQMGHVYLNSLETLSQMNNKILTACGHHNKKAIAEILMTIANQQSSKLLDIKDIDD